MSDIDKSKVSAAFDRAAGTYDVKAEFQHQVCDRLKELLLPQIVTAQHPAKILDGGCGTGYGAELLQQQWPSAQVTGCDLAPEMVKMATQRGIPAVCGDLEHLPFTDAKFDLVWSSLALQWCRPELAFSELQRILAPGGSLAFTTLGTGTLHELEAAFSGIDPYRRVLKFTTAPAVEEALTCVGLEHIRIVPETWVTHHADFNSLLASIRGIGASQSGSDRRRSLMGKNAWQTARARYEAKCDADGLLPVTYELMFVFADKKR